MGQLIDGREDLLGIIRLLFRSQKKQAISVQPLFNRHKKLLIGSFRWKKEFLLLYAYSFSLAAAASDVKDKGTLSSREKGERMLVIFPSQRTSRSSERQW